MLQKSDKKMVADGIVANWRKLFKFGLVFVFAVASAMSVRNDIPRPSIENKHNDSLDTRKYDEPDTLEFKPVFKITKE
jgi:hypothetical protein